MSPIEVNISSTKNKKGSFNLVGFVVKYSLYNVKATQCLQNTYKLSAC